MANMNQHTVKLVSWDMDKMTAIYTIDSDLVQYTVEVPRYDPSFSSSPPSASDAIAWIKKCASEEIDAETGLPDLSSYVGSIL